MGVDRWVPVATTLAAPCAAGDTKIAVANLAAIQQWMILWIEGEAVWVKKIGKRRLRVERGLGPYGKPTGHPAGARVEILGCAMPDPGGGATAPGMGG